MKLSSEDEIAIRCRLDEIQARMYHDAVIFDDVYWSHKTIKELLLIIYAMRGWKGDG